MDEKQRMQIIADNITYYRKQKNITQKELAKAVGITPSTMTDYMKLRSAPSFGVIQKLADFFGVRKSDIDTTFKETPQPPQDAPDSLTQAINDKVVLLDPPRKEIVLDVATDQLNEQEKEKEKATASLEELYIEEPLFEYHVFEKLSAGTGATYWEDRNYDTVYFDEELAHDFASWVFGDSMEPVYLNGEVALIREGGFDYDGAIYAVDWDGQSYIKKVYKEENGLRLVSLNPKYSDKFAPYDEDPRIIGKVIGSFTPMER